MFGNKHKNTLIIFAKFFKCIFFFIDAISNIATNRYRTYQVRSSDTTVRKTGDAALFISAYAGVATLPVGFLI